MNPKSKILAHRGWSAKYPENTRLAFRKALELGIDGLEFDVQLTADEVPVVIHDQTINRITNGKGEVSKMKYEDLERFRVGAKGKAIPIQHIPSLQDVLDDAYTILPDGLYNIELKVYNAHWRALVDHVLSVVNQHALKDNVLYSSFHHGALSYLKSCCSNAKIGLLYDDDIVDPWYPAKQLNAYSVHLDYRFTNADMVFNCHQHGVEVAVWTVDRPMSLRRCFKIGTDIVISNKVKAAKDVRETTILGAM